MTFRALLSLIGIVTLVGTLTSLRREHIRAEYSISWLAGGLIITVIAIYPRLLQYASAALGVDAHIAFLILAAGMVSALTFEISHVVSRLRDENVVLAQKVAILEYEFHRAAEGKDVKNP